MLKFNRGVNVAKLNLFLFVSILSFHMYSPKAFSASKVFLIKDTKFKIHVPENWQSAPGFYGSELAMLGPVKGKKRPVIMFDQTGLDDYQFDSTELTDSYERFKLGRRQWFKKNRATEQSFYPYKLSSWANIAKVHTFSFSYQMLGESYKESHYFFQCKEKTYNVHVLTTTKQLDSNKQTIDKVLNSVSCL